MGHGRKEDRVRGKAFLGNEKCTCTISGSSGARKFHSSKNQNHMPVSCSDIESKLLPMAGDEVPSIPRK